MIQIGILALPGCLSSAVYGFAEIIMLANSMHSKPFFSYVILGEKKKPVQSYTGTRILPESSIKEEMPDIIVIPPILGNLDEVLILDSVVSWLARVHTAGRKITTVCAGAFLLAETGVLNGRDATTHWVLAEMFRSRYPEINLELQRMVIDGGDYICCGGVSAWIDLALYIITCYVDKETSRNCANMMLVDLHRKYQTPYGMGGFRKNHGDEPILQVQTWIENNYTDSLTIVNMAKKAFMTERTFLRRFRAATGKTPHQYLQQIRIEAAQGLLETTKMSVEKISESIGYEDWSAFRKLFKKMVGSTPSLYRQRFGNFDNIDR